MITFTILLITLLATVAVTGLGIGVAIVFGDLIVCGLFIYWIVKLFRKRK